MKTRIFLTGLLFLLISFANNATAENKAKAFTISPMIGGYLFEGDQDIEDKAMYGLGLGYNIDQNWGLEGMFNFIDTDSEKEAGDIDVYTYRLDALYHFMPDKKLVPYIATGFGGMTFDPDRDKNDTDFLVNYGGGIKYFINDFTALRADVRHIISFDETYNNLAYTFGITFLLGGEKKAIAAEYKDSDGDGVYDHLDQCLNTPQGVSVDETGCPIKSDSDGDGVFDDLDNCPDTPKEAIVDDAGCPLDSDGDGVYDYLDNCPDTPKEITVDDTGCPLDSDGDGVFDYQDSCPDTPKEAKVDERGCWVLHGVLFGTAKAAIKPVSFTVLDNVVLILKNNPLLSLGIDGHTDSTGSQSYNKTLSANRAMAVMDYFLAKGIAASRLTTKGFASSKPAASNDTPEGRALNRRVELTPVR